MEYINDEDLLLDLLEREQVLSHFETAGLDFRLLKYRKGELICAPGKAVENLLFVTAGHVWVYQLREDGSSVTVSRGVGRTVIGTMEFVRKDLPVFYTEAIEDVLCVALPIEKNRAALERDRVFLRFVLDRLAEMIVMFTLIGQGEVPVEEKVLTFLRDIQPDHTLHSINGGLLQFHCSRRQLQRVVKKLCGEGTLKKVGKGKYRLVQK